jgi:DNA-binding MarR family transcriptional regulator
VAEPVDDTSGSWLNVSELARVRGQDKGGISRRVARLEELGALTTRPGPGRTKLINADEFARAVETLTDTVREANGRRATGPRESNGGASSDPVLGREQARRAKADADLKEMQRDERLGQLARVDDIASGAALQGETLARIIDRLPDRADDLAAVVAKEGSTGLRAALKVVARELRGALANAFAALAEAPKPESAKIDEAEPQDAEALA